MSGKFDEITYEQVIADAKLEINLENSSDYDGYMELRADEAMRSINSLSQFELITKEVEVNDNSFKVPCGFIRLSAIWLKNAQGNCYKVPYVDRDVNTYCGCNYPTFGDTFSVMMNGPYVNFNYSSTEFTSASIAYVGMRMNSDNMPVMAERFQRCVRAYICWRTLSKMARNQPVQLRQVMKQDAKEYQREYVLQRDFIRGRDQMESFYQNRNDIGRIFNAWITRTNTMYSN